MEKSLHDFNTRLLHRLSMVIAVSSVLITLQEDSGCERQSMDHFLLVFFRLSELSFRRQVIDLGRGVYLITRPTGPWLRHACLRRLRRKECMFESVIRAFIPVLCYLRLAEGGAAVTSNF
ncbi:hypothetical protein TNCV_1128941 [Trichonephila clavipes]|nr:hypothetical protein TNCV_1128941 [Trichonephila clavipes]